MESQYVFGSTPIGLPARSVPKTAIETCSNRVATQNELPVVQPAGHRRHARS
jgi:hypothetical protein